MSDEFDSYAPGSNLKEDFRGRITDRSRFKKAERGEGFVAQFVIQAQDGDEVTVNCSLGTDWQSFDGGKSVEHPKGGEKQERKFGGGTGYSEFIVFALGGFEGDTQDTTGKPAGIEKGLGAAEYLREQNRLHQNRGAQFMEPWWDTEWQFDVLKRPQRMPKFLKAPDGSVMLDSNGKEIIDEWVEGERDRQLPTRFYGKVGQGTLDSADQSAATTTTNTDTGSSAPAPPESATPSSPAAASGVLGHKGLADLTETVDKLAIVKLAKEKDFGDFVDAVCVLTRKDGGSMMEVASVMDHLGAEEMMWKDLRG